MEIQVISVNYMTTFLPGSAVVMLPSEYKRIKDSLVVRYRSRGRHQPGSGNYACAHLSCSALPANAGRFIVYPGSYYEDDTGWLSGNQQFCSFDCVGDTYRFVKAYKQGGVWRIRLASAFRIAYIGGSYPWSAWEVAKCTSYQGDGIPRTTNVTWTDSSGWWQSQQAYPLNVTVDFHPQFNLAEIMDYYALTPPLAISNLVANAYVDAISKAPTNDVNNIGNLFAAYDLLKSLMAGPEKLVVRGASDVVANLADAWLQYRYVYQTTAMDIHETAEYLIRSSEVKGGPVHCNGYQTLKVDDAEFVARCSVTLTPEGYSSLQSEVERFGLALSAYAAWDMVPWSFVVDWFFHIGDRLEYYNKRNRALRLEPGPCWYSITKNYRDPSKGANVSFYYRWKGDKPTTSGCFVDHPTSNATIVKRAIDVWALTR